MSVAVMTRRRALAAIGATSLGLGALLSSTPVEALCASPTIRWGLHARFALSRPRGSALAAVRGSGPMTVIENLDAVRLVGAGATPHALAAEEVAEGVTLLRIPADLAPGRYALRGIGTTETTLEITDVAMPAVAALRSRGLRRERARASSAGGVEDGTERLVLHLAGTVPVEGMVIAHWTQDGAPASTWGAIEREVPPRPSIVPTRYLAILASVGRCAGHGRFPPPGTSVTFRYVDAFGQIGPESRTARVPR